VPFFLGEFGVFHGRFANLFAADMYSFLDANFLSGCQWSYTPNWSPTKKDGWNGEDLSVVADGQTRGFPFMPSPRRIAGTPVSSKSIPSVAYELSWKSGPVHINPCLEVYFPSTEFCGTTKLPIVEAPSSLRCEFKGAYMVTCDEATGTTVAESLLTLRLVC
jgi:hypothetical protein